jgi:hypothetical protein
MKNEKNIFLWVIGFFLIIMILQTNIIKKQETDLTGMKIHYYRDGVEIIPEKGLFSIIASIGESGNVYDQIAFEIKLTNDGTVPITNIIIEDASPIEFKNSLEYVDINLSAGESKTIFSNVIDVNKFQYYTQPIEFSINFVGFNGYTYEMLQVKESLKLLIMEEIVLLRFEKISSSTDFKNSWVSFDYDNDGKLEAFGNNGAYWGSSSLCATPSDSQFISYYGPWTVQRDMAWEQSLEEIDVCKNNNYGGSSGYTFYTYGFPAVNANLELLKVDEFSLNGREVYNFVQSQVCGNNIKEKFEVCDGGDLGFQNCSSIGEGFIGGTLACKGYIYPPNQLQCKSFDTSGCIRGNYVTFRTSRLLYQYSDTAVAYSPTCGGDLVAYGKTGNTCMGYYCDEEADLEIPSLVGKSKMWVKSSTSLCICNEESIITSSYPEEYTTTDSDASKVSTSKSIINPKMEIVC